MASTATAIAKIPEEVSTTEGPLQFQALKAKKAVVGDSLFVGELLAQTLFLLDHLLID